METPTLKSIEQVSEGWINKYVLTYELPDGTPHTYEAASRRGLEEFRAHLQANAEGVVPRSADAVCIAALTPRDTVVLIREFRYPLNSWCIALPAGLMDEGETLEQCANRELREETGYGFIPGEPVTALPQAGYSSTGLTDETVQIVFCMAEKLEEAHTEPGELIEVFELPRAQIGEFLQQNTTPIGTRAQLVLEALKD